MIALLLFSACGRIQFAGVPDASDGAAACDPSVPFGAPHVIEELSLPGSTDGGLRLSDDELSAYFHSTRGFGVFRVWEAHRTSRMLPFETPTVLVTTTSLWPTVSVDGLTLVYNANSPDDFYVAKRGSASEPFPAATPITDLNTGSNESAPFFGRTTQTLYFARIVPEGSLLQSAWPPTGAGLETMIPGVNTASVEQAPVLSRDELTIYFTRGTPGLEIYAASRATTEDAFAPAAQLAELVSPAGESPTWISPDNCRLYFESSRTSDFDLYVAERVP